MDKTSLTDHELLVQLWVELGGAAEATQHVQITGPRRGLPSVYEVSALASASVAVATLAVAELQAARTWRPLRAVSVERAHADAAFTSERHLRAIGWQLPEVWDPLAGDYPTRDGYVRLHTNYSHHRAAALRVLTLSGPAVTREQVARALASRDAEVVEAEVVAAGGCAAKLRSPAGWSAHPQGQSIACAPLFDLSLTPAPSAELPELTAAVHGRPLAGLRVLDLTRVIAGPIGTRLLAAYGADVLRVDPPGFQEVGALLCDITAGKRRATLDLEQAADRAQFSSLVREADVIVHGYRHGALASLGFGNAALRELNHSAVIVCHDAYGWSGPWTERRGFDSLVQMSCGIAWRGREVLGSDKPTPLPAQALDHATGYLIAAAACRALTRRAQTGDTSLVRLSLARSARLLMELGDLGVMQGEAAPPHTVSTWLEEVDSAFGRVQRVRCPGQIEGAPPAWHIPAGPLGVDPAHFSA